MIELIKRFEINTKGYDYAVGDIHGTYTRLQEELNRIGFREDVDRLFAVGDLVDRGKENFHVVQWLDKPWFHTIRGNHDQMAIEYVDGEQDAYLYAYNGGKWFIDLPRNDQEFIANKFKELPYLMTVNTELGTIGFVHADPVKDNWYDLERTINDENIQVQAIWDRSLAQLGLSMGYRGVEGVRAVICGHTPMTKRKIVGNVHFIDSGAVFGNPFCIIRLDNLEQV